MATIWLQCLSKIWLCTVSAARLWVPGKKLNPSPKQRGSGVGGNPKVMYRYTRYYQTYSRRASNLVRRLGTKARGEAHVVACLTAAWGVSACVTTQSRKRGMVYLVIQMRVVHQNLYRCQGQAVTGIIMFMCLVRVLMWLRCRCRCLSRCCCCCCCCCRRCCRRRRFIANETRSDHPVATQTMTTTLTDDVEEMLSKPASLQKPQLISVTCFRVNEDLLSDSIAKNTSCRTDVNTMIIPYKTCRGPWPRSRSAPTWALTLSAPPLGLNATTC